MPTDTGRAFTTANFLTGLPALKAINFGSADPAGVWFVVPNVSTNNIEVWVWQPASVVAPDEISVVRPDSVIPGSPGRCIQSLKLDVSQIVGILGSIANLSTNGLIKKDGNIASTATLSAFGETLIDDADSAAGRATLGLDSVNNTADAAKSVASAATLTPGRNINGVLFNGSSNITLTAANLGLGSVDNTSDAGKPISSATQTALNLKADLASPTFTGNLVIPSAAGTSVGTVWRNVNNLEYKDSLNVTQILLNSAGNLVNLSNKQTALNTLSGTQVGNRVLRSDGTNVTLSQVSLTTDVINVLPGTLGGTGQSVYTVGDVLFASTTTALSKLANVATGNTLISGGVGVAPSYGKVGLTTHISGVLPISNGGTGSATQNFVDLTAAQTIGGAKTFAAPIVVTNTTASTSTTTGASVVAGGVGVGGILNASGLQAPNIWELEPRSGATAVNANNLVYPQFAGTKWLDGSATNLNVPINSGMIHQFDTLFGTGSQNLYRVQEFYVNNRKWMRQENNGVWAAWKEFSFL